jgi:uncharacterized membrane protein YebE (DUF533 family)
MLKTTLTIGQLAYNAYNFFTEKDDEFQINSLEFAKICVSLWSRCCPADIELADEGCEAVEELLTSLFGKYSLFPENISDREEIYKKLINTFTNPLSMKTVIKVAINNDNTATKFYEQACYIFSANGLIATEEREFLDDLARELDISRMDKKSAERKYLRL